MEFDLLTHTILLTIAGSRAYGIHRRTSDVDVKGVGIAPARYYHGFLRQWEQAEGTNMQVFLDWDAEYAEIAPGNLQAAERHPIFRPLVPDLIRRHAVPGRFTEEEVEAIRAQKLEGTVYDIRKFVALAADCNPNILDVLFCRDEEVRLCTPLGRRLREARELFLSAKAKHTFSGYAAAQLKRIKGHRKWLLDPPTHQPSRAEFGLPENTLIPADQLAAVRAAIQKRTDQWELDLSGLPDAEIIHLQGRVSEVLTEIAVNLGFESTDEARWLAAARDIGLDANLIYVLQKEREYEAAARHFKQFKEWERGRNADRAVLEAAHGYDTKHAAHLVRLLKMGREILTTGKVNVWRGGIDAEELLAIRAGAWSYDQLVGWAENEDAALGELYRTRRYVVPKEPDRNAIDVLCVELVEEALRG